MHRAFILLAIAVTLSRTASAQPGSTNVLSVMERAADWQLAHPSRHDRTDWTQGAFYAGMMALDSVSSSPRFREAMVRMGESNQWKLGPRIYHADDYCVGQTYAELFMKSNDAKMLAPMR